LRLQYYGSRAVRNPIYLSESSVPCHRFWARLGLRFKVVLSRNHPLWRQSPGFLHTGAVIPHPTGRNARIVPGGPVDGFQADSARLCEIPPDPPLPIGDRYDCRPPFAG